MLPLRLADPRARTVHALHALPPVLVGEVPRTGTFPTVSMTIRDSCGGQWPESARECPGPFPAGFWGALAPGDSARCALAVLAWSVVHAADRGRGRPSGSANGVRPVPRSVCVCPEGRVRQRTCETALSGRRTRCAGLLRPPRHLPRDGGSAEIRGRIRVLRWTAVRQWPAALRKSAGRACQGRDAALPNHAGDAGPSDDSAGPRTGPPNLTPRGNSVALAPPSSISSAWGRRPLLRVLPQHGDALHPRVARLCHPAGPLGRLRPVPQDP